MITAYSEKTAAADTSTHFGSWVPASAGMTMVFYGLFSRTIARHPLLDGRILLHPGKPSARHALCRLHHRSPRRIYQHREGLIPGFTKRYGVKRLVYVET